jgi:hypothetical protein
MIEELTADNQNLTSSALTEVKEAAILVPTTSETQKLNKKRKKSKKQSSRTNLFTSIDASELATFSSVRGMIMFYQRIFLGSKNLGDSDFVLLDERLDKQFGVAEQHTNLFIRALVTHLLHFCYDGKNKTFNTPRFKNVSSALKKRVSKRADLQMAALIACQNLNARLQYPPGKSLFKKIYFFKK